MKEVGSRLMEERTLRHDIDERFSVRITTTESELDSKIGQKFFFWFIGIAMLILMSLMGIMYSDIRVTDAKVTAYKDEMFQTISSIAIDVAKIDENVKGLKEDFKRLENAN